MINIEKTFNNLSYRFWDTCKKISTRMQPAYINKKVDRALQKRDLSALKELFRRGVDPQAINDQGDTLLHRLASLPPIIRLKQAGKTDTALSKVFEFLISKNIAMGAKNDQGQTAYDITNSNGNYNLALLINK